MNDLTLTTFRFDPDTCIPQAQPKFKGGVTAESSALDVMTDLAVVKAETIDPNVKLREAEQVMINRGVRALFVTSNFPCIDGLVTAADILGEKPLKLVTQENSKFQDLTVLDVMTDLPHLDVVDYDEVKNALVANLVATFAKLKCTHILVVQAAKIQGPARIRGVISQTQLERQLSSKATGW
jgi:CBS-domain-containing membrane protein